MKSETFNGEEKGDLQKELIFYIYTHTHAHIICTQTQKMKLILNAAQTIFGRA